MVSGQVLASAFKYKFSINYLISFGSQGNTFKSKAKKRLLVLIIVSLRLSQMEYL